MKLVERLMVAKPTKVNEHSVFAQCDLLKIFERDMRLAADMIKGLRKALKDIEQMEPGLVDGDSSCDMSAVVAGMALAALAD